MRYFVPLGLIIGLAASCWRADLAHCGSNAGDASCPSGMFCDACEPDNNGCVSQQPSALCHVAAAEGTEAGTLDGTIGDTMDPEGSGTSATEGSSDATEGMTTGPTGCENDDDCPSLDAPFCDPTGACVACDALTDPDGACAGQDPTTPVCAAGLCVQCTTDQAGTCDGQTPVCGADNTCIACTEHAQCPQSACHLDGSDAGACFDTAVVTMIGNPTDLSTALAALGPDDDAVFVLEAGTYGVTVDVGSNAEVAVLSSGMSPPILTGNGARALEVFGNALVYLWGVQVSNTDIGGDGLSCSGAAVWLDDSDVRNNSQIGMDISGGCAAHLRRTVIYDNNAGGLDISSGQLSMRNSAVGRNGDGFSSTVGGLRLDGTAVDITYSSIVGNEALNSARGSLFCVGGETGSVRNSILVGTGSSIDGCDGLTFTGDAVDDASIMGTDVQDVGPAVPAWFTGLGVGDFHLTTTGEMVLDGIATWEPGDPLVDVDGDPIATDGVSTPGYDQPQ